MTKTRKVINNYFKLKKIFGFPKIVDKINYNVGFSLTTKRVDSEKSEYFELLMAMNEVQE